MSKPIFIVGLPEYTEQEAQRIISSALEARMPDYHALTYVHTGSDMNFQVFHVKDHEELDIEEIKAYLINKLKDGQ
jgi:hypothetical protein